MIEDTTADPTDRIGNSPADHLYENAMLTVLVACFISFWLVTAHVMLRGDDRLPVPAWFKPSFYPAEGTYPAGPTVPTCTRGGS